MKCLINIDGGLGKNVMLTSLMPILAKKYDEIYIISPYVDIWKACSYITEAFEPGPQCATLYQELVLADDCDILWKEPYSNQRFIKKQIHMLQAWLDEADIDEPYSSELLPVIDNVDEAFPNLKKQTDDKLHEMNIDKFILVQFCGGQSPLAPQQDAQGNPIPYNDRVEAIKRNYYNGQQLINKLKEEYPDVTIVHYALPNEPTYDGAVKLGLPYISYPYLASKALKVICTDSSLQHLSTGNCKDVTVIWGETRPEHFGWECNKNICAKHVLNSQPYFKPMGISPSLVKMPSVDEVMRVVKQGDVEVTNIKDAESNVTDTEHCEVE